MVRYLLGTVRLAAVGFHLAGALTTVALMYPWVGPARRHRLKRLWSRALLVLLGVRLRRHGEWGGSGALIVANHTSWLDVFVINAVVPATFVCKADVRGWPVVGWLCTRTDTLFLERGSRRGARLAANRVQDALERGQTVAVFPEGTTGDGASVLPFHPALFQPAIDAGHVLRPVALRYTDGNGRCSRAAAYDGDISLGRSLASICFARGLAAELHLLPGIDARQQERRELAAAARMRIATCLSQTEIPPPASRPGAHDDLGMCPEPHRG